MKKICDKRFDQERALYNLTDAEVCNCAFGGEADGESALKETRNVTLTECEFDLRYPLWHADGFAARKCAFFEPSRAPMWYCKNGTLKDCYIKSVKAVRECDGIELERCNVVSPEFGWKSKNLTLTDCKVESEYLLLDSQNVTANKLEMKGKYSFQYMQNVTIADSTLNTKDAFWHSKNVTVKNCKVAGEYLGWYSQNLTFIDCEISGTQPLCYCKNLVLINCTMTGCDLSFEYSEVQADIVGKITSVKNPKSGKIVADGIGEIVQENDIMKGRCEIIVRK
ncbi:MAG: DUF3737 family protein [Corallococcus sp.]|nr:DUF3737 family protein [Corallococcus sp.]MCM1359947.1 DUF3737 family protein [Corallococcus sp.]MCM1395503.1 DUF3737 family protein [Corallococcus sp.]